ncbi:hypothetical protein [Geothrix campi]|uniref:hypothetical protein n=1 Tax=Geothrix campi TaxID=2966450 RepID=UPI0021485C62|nr:hypothetical protein [Geothrix sp. SG10]
MAMGLLKRFAQALKPAPVESNDQRWRAAAPLDRGRLGEARLALDHRGRGLALWENGGSLWTMPMGPAASPALSRLPFGEGVNPRLALNPEGRGLAVWLADLGEERQILGKALGAGEDLGHVVFRTPGLVRHLQVAVDRRGDALVVWLHEKVGRIEVMAHSFSTRGEAWEKEPVILGLPSDPMASPRLAANQREHAMVLWEGQDSLFEGLLASHYWPSDRIWSDRPVPVVAHAAHHHQVAMDDHGNALALWIHAPYGQRGALEASFYNVQEGDWSEPVTLTTSQEISSPRLIMNGEGEALAAWCQRESGGVSRLFSKAFRRRAWEPGVECLDQDEGRPHDYALDMGPDGRAGFLVVQRGATGDHVSLRTRQGVWSAPRIMGSAPGSICESPRLAMCPHGTSVLWTQGTGDEKTLVLVDSH